jgi:hypothetical protein
LTIGGTAKIHPWVNKPVTTVTAFAVGIVFVKLNRLSAFGTVYVKYGFGLPVLHILTGAFHVIAPPSLSIKWYPINLTQTIKHDTGDCFDLGQEAEKRNG